MGQQCRLLLEHPLLHIGLSHLVSHRGRTLGVRELLGARRLGLLLQPAQLLLQPSQQSLGASLRRFGLGRPGDGHLLLDRRRLGALAEPDLVILRLPQRDALRLELLVGALHRLPELAHLHPQRLVPLGQLLDGLLAVGEQGFRPHEHRRLDLPARRVALLLDDEQPALHGDQLGLGRRGRLFGRRRHRARRRRRRLGRLALEGLVGAVGSLLAQLPHEHTQRACGLCPRRLRRRRRLHLAPAHRLAHKVERLPSLSKGCRLLRTRSRFELVLRCEGVALGLGGGDGALQPADLHVARLELLLEH